MSECPYCRKRKRRPFSCQTKEGVFAIIDREGSLAHDPTLRDCYLLSNMLRGTPMPEPGEGMEMVMTAYFDGGYTSGTARVPISYCPFCGRDLREETE